MHPPSPSSHRYVRSVRLGLIWAIVIAVVCLRVAGDVLWRHLLGQLVAPPGEPEWVVMIDYVAGGGALVLGLAALFAIFMLLRSRFEIDREGVRWQRLDLRWESVRAVRILVAPRTEPAPVGATLSDVWLELSLREPDLTPAQQGALRSLRIPWTATEGYSHHIRISGGEIMRKSEPADFAPAIQRVLATAAAPIYQGTVLRRTPTGVPG